MGATGKSRASTAAVGVITVSYGSGDVLEAFLRCLREHEGIELDVVVVDNKPDAENVAAIAEKYGAGYLPLPDNPGYGAGMNRGVERLNASGETHQAYFFCNPDVEFVEPTIGKLTESLSTDPHAGSIGPRLLNEDGTTYPSARQIPSITTGVGHALLGKVWRNNPWSRSYKRESEYGERRSAGSLSGAAVMVKENVYRMIGGWDEEYFMHFEDIDLGYRIGEAGFLNIFDPVVSLIHSGAHSTKKHAVRVEKAMTASAIRFMRKRYAGALRSPLRWGVVLGLRLRGVLTVASAQRTSNG